MRLQTAPCEAHASRLNDIMRIPPGLALARRLSWRGPFIMGLGLLAAVWILLFWRGPAIMDADVWRHLTAGERIVAVSQFRTMLADLPGSSRRSGPPSQRVLPTLG